MYFQIFTLVSVILLSANFFIKTSASVYEPDLESRHLSTRVVHTRYGTVRGFISTLSNRQLQPVEVYLGVPYAGAPTGSLRFMPPVTSPHWKGVRIADTWGPVCPQKFPDITDTKDALKRMPAGRLRYLQRLIPHLTYQSEDCLYLNIYAPAIVGRQPLKLPVMVYIHGESYEWNAGNPYDGRVLSSYGNVIVVTINYRLGVLGFLPAVDRLARGNYGLMDQVAALHWIQDNILEFGGDPYNITIFGQGHGAACVNFLMLSPMAKGLFHRAIMQSGSALSPWAVARDAISHTHMLAEALNCSTQDSMALIECLRRRRLEDIMSVDIPVPDHLTGFGPTVDGIVLSHDPVYLMETKPDLFLRYDLLLGATKVESYFSFSANEETFGIRTHRRDRILRTLVRNLFIHHLQQIFFTVVNEYMDWSLPMLHQTDIFSGTVAALSDSTVVAPLILTAMLHSNPQFPPGMKPLFYLQPKTYFYTFTHQTENGDYSPKLGCISGEDMAYVFGAPLVAALSHFSSNYTAEEMALAEITMKHWTNFAKFSDPNVGSQLGDLTMDISGGRNEAIIWPEFTANHQKYLSISLNPRVRDHYNAHKLSYWLKLIPTLDSPDNSTSEKHHMLEDHHNISSYDGKVRASYIDVVQNIKGDTFYQGNATGADLSSTADRSSGSNSTDMQIFGLDKGAYMSALGVTIAVGCSLLMLNIVVFAAIYYQKDKMNVAKKVQSAFYQVECGGDNEDEPSYKKPYLLKEAPSSMIMHDFEPLQAYNKDQPIFDIVESSEIKRQLEKPPETEFIKNEKPHKIMKTVKFLEVEPLLIDPPDSFPLQEPGAKKCQHDHLTFKSLSTAETDLKVDR